MNANMKYVFPKDKPLDLIPDNVKLYKMLPEIKQTARLGRLALLPVELGAEGGVTYGTGAAFAYEDTVEGAWGEAQIDCNPVVLNMQLSRSLIDRLNSDTNAFIDVMTLRTRSMSKELARRAECSMFYGKSPSGLGTVGAITGTSGTSLVITFTSGQWAPGIWAGRKNHRFEVRSNAGVHRAGGLTNMLTLTTVDFVNKKCTFTGNAGEIATVVATDVVYFRGSYTNDMTGFDTQLTKSGTVFNVDNSVYELWKGSAYTLASTAFSEFIKGVGVAVAQGGLSDDTVAFINSTKWEALNSTVTNQNYRNQGGSDNAAAKAGVEAMSFTTQAGRTTLVGSPYIKEGDGFIWSMKDLVVVGTKKISFDSSNGEGQYWVDLPSNYGAQMQGAYEFNPVLTAPANAIKLTVP
jgi:hypothetical protein